MTTPIYMSEQYAKYFFTSSSVSDRPEEWELSLHTGNPGVSGNENEVTEGSFYERQPISFSASEHSSGTHFFVLNTDAIVFPAGMEGDSFTITHYSVRDKQANKALASASLPEPIDLREGVVVVFPKESIKIRGI